MYLSEGISTFPGLFLPRSVKIVSPFPHFSFFNCLSRLLQFPPLANSQALTVREVRRIRKDNSSAFSNVLVPLGARLFEFCHWSLLRGVGFNPWFLHGCFFTSSFGGFFPSVKLLT